MKKNTNSDLTKKVSSEETEHSRYEKSRNQLSNRYL